MSAASGGQRSEYYAQVESAYDRFAEDYDGMVGMHPSAARAKAAALSRLTGLVRPGARLLDVGCGTGREAVALARKGFRVTGIDSVGKMVETAGRRASGAGLLVDECRFRQLRASGLGALSDEGLRFDGCYSFYAVLNLEPDVASVARSLARLLPTGAPLVIGLLGPTVLFELSLYPLFGSVKGFRKAAARPVRLKLASGGEDEVDCFLYTPAGFARLMRPWFELREVAGIHILLPPPRETLLRFPALLRMVNRIESSLETRFPWNLLGYFSLLTLARTEVEV